MRWEWIHGQGKEDVEKFVYLGEPQFLRKVGAHKTSTIEESKPEGYLPRLRMISSSKPKSGYRRVWLTHSCCMVTIVRHRGWTNVMNIRTTSDTLEERFVWEDMINITIILCTSSWHLCLKNPLGKFWLIIWFVLAYFTYLFLFVLVAHMAVCFGMFWKNMHSLH